MRRTTALLALPLAALATFGTTTVASAGSVTGNSTAYLSGAREAPGPGDRDGVGLARVAPGLDQVCVQIRYRNIDPPTMAHIHEGPPGVAGPVVVSLTDLIATSPPGQINGCVPAAPELTADIAASPSDYYVNVHNDAYPAGAIRGQLRAYAG